MKIGRLVNITQEDVFTVYDFRLRSFLLKTYVSVVANKITLSILIKFRTKILSSSQKI